MQVGEGEGEVEVETILSLAHRRDETVCGIRIRERKVRIGNSGG